MPRLALILSFFATLLHAQAIITTIAGGGQFQVAAVRGPATNVLLGQIYGVATDPQGNVFAIDATNHIVVKVATTGTLTVVGGNGTMRSSGDGGLATNASFQGPSAIAANGVGNLFIGDGCAVRKISADGTISTFAGTGSCGYSGDGGLATQALIGGAAGIALDSKGNLYFSDNNRIRKVTPQGIISTVAGNGLSCCTGDGVPATATALNSPYGLVVDQNGVLYIAETGNDRVRRVGSNGIITTIAGGSGEGYSGDGGAATGAMLNRPEGIALDAAGVIYVADTNNERVRRITPDGIIQTVAGTGEMNFTGDQGQASLATLHLPMGVATDGFGNVYIADSFNYRVRRVDPLGTITTYAGRSGAAGDGGQARDAVLSNPASVVVDASGNVYISDTRNNCVRRIAPNGIITTVAGSGTAGFGGDGGPATQASLNLPVGLALDSIGNLYIADAGNVRVRKIDPSGTITTVAGNGAVPWQSAGDGGPAVNASFIGPEDVAVDAAGNVYIVDGGLVPNRDGSFNSNRIRLVSPDGTISTFAVGMFTAVAVDAAGNVYASVLHDGVYRIFPGGATTSVASNLAGPGKVAIDPQGNLYVPVSSNIGSGTRVILVSPTGAETGIAGNGQAGFSGDDGPANLAQLYQPRSAALDSAGNLYIADSGNNRIRKVFLNPASGLFQPTLQTTLQPGYYTVTVTLGQGEQPGYWGMQVLAPAGVLAGGFNLGGTVQQSSQAPGFGAFYLPTAQTLHVHIDAQAADGSSSSSVQLGAQLLDASKNPVSGPQFGGTSLDFTQPLSPGYYILAVNGGANSPNENFQMALSAPYFFGGGDVGGFAGPNSVGFGAFNLTAAQQVSIQVYGQPSYGAAGAGGLRLTLYDANRKVIAAVP